MLGIKIVHPSEVMSPSAHTMMKFINIFAFCAGLSVGGIEGAVYLQAGMLACFSLFLPRKSP